MKKTADYRKHAEECRGLARGAISEQERAQLIQMAETWESLASDREGYAARNPGHARKDGQEGGSAA